MVGFRASLQASLFDRPEVAAFLAAEEGSIQFRRYLEIVEMLRLALLQYADVIETRSRGPGEGAKESKADN